MNRLNGADWHRWVRHCARVTGTREDAEDCVQDALVAALSKRVGEIDDVEGWVATVSRRRAVDVVRHRAATKRALTRVGSDVDAGDVADDVAARAEANWLAGRLGELPTTTAAVVRQLADGASLAEAAVELGLTYRSAESHVTRARRWARRATC